MLSTIVTTGLGIGLALLMASPSHAAVGTSAGGARAEDEECKVIDFEKADVSPLASTGTSVRYRLTVSGMKSASNVNVTLLPLVYVRQPEFWGIEVTGCSSGIGLPVVTPYTATLDFTGTMGSCGIEVIGTSNRKQFDLAGCGSLPLAGTSWVLDPATLGVPVPAGASVTAEFSDTKMSGSTSCNLYSADYSLAKDGAFKLGAIAVTKRACEPDVMAVESAFLKRLPTMTHASASSKELVLWSEGRTQLRFTPAKPVKSGTA